MRHVVVLLLLTTLLLIRQDHFVWCTGSPSLSPVSNSTYSNPRNPHILNSNKTAIPGPTGSISYNDGNETITIDFSDVEFYPVENSFGFPLHYSGSNELFRRNFLPGIELHSSSTSWEQNVIKSLIGAIDFDNVHSHPKGRIISASDLPHLLNSLPGHPLHQGTPDYHKSYGISSHGPSIFDHKKFTTLTVDANFGPDNVRYYSMARFQNGMTFGRKIIRLAMWQSLNQGNPRHIWLSDNTNWGNGTLTPLGRIMTPSGFSILWTI